MPCTRLSCEVPWRPAPNATLADPTRLAESAMGHHRVTRQPLGGRRMRCENRPLRDGKLAHGGASAPLERAAKPATGRRRPEGIGSMFGNRKLMREGAQAQALVLDKKIWGYLQGSGVVTACTYTLKVQFDDSSTVEIKRRVMHQDAAWVGVGELLPVRYDSSDRSKIELDEPGLKAQLEENTRALKAREIASGERKLAQASAGRPASPANDLTDTERLAEVLRRRRNEGS
jgi:hypothetical protein